MDARFKSLYQDELRFLRESAAEFAAEEPDIARGLSLSETTDRCPDPYVERLLEGVAFLTARIRLQLDAEFPRLTSHLLDTIYPHYLAPTPAMGIVRLLPDLSDASLVDGPVFPRGAWMRQSRPIRVRGTLQDKACQYVTAHEVRIWPLRIEHASYHARDMGVLHLPEHMRGREGPRAALCIRMELTAGELAKLDLDDIVFHLPGDGPKPIRLYEQIFAHTSRVLLRSTEPVPHTQIELGDDAVSQVGFEDDEALLPVDARCFSGYRLLKEYACCPKRFFFFRVGDLQHALRRIQGRTFEIVLLFDREDERLDDQVSKDDLALFCTPVINLFEFPQAATIRLSERRVEYPIIPDPTRRLDYEVHSVTGVHAIGHAGRELHPFYAGGEAQGRGGAYYAITRRPRAPVDSERDPDGRIHWRSEEYHGSDAFISIVDAAGSPTMTEFEALDLGMLVTNRDLPLHLARDPFRSWEESAVPLEGIELMGSISPPYPALSADSGAWALISHLQLNYLSLIEREDPEQSARPLRQMLRLYAPVPEGARYDTLRDDAWSDQIRGIQRVLTEPITRRVPVPGPISFAKGLRVSIEVDEGRFDASGALLLGAVLERFLARYASINSVIETAIRSKNRLIKVWPTRLGRIDIL